MKEKKRKETRNLHGLQRVDGITSLRPVLSCA